MPAVSQEKSHFSFPSLDLDAIEYMRSQLAGLDSKLKLRAYKNCRKLGTEVRLKYCMSRRGTM